MNEIKGAYFDCSFGAAGDMLLAALLDCGADLDFIETELRKLDLNGEDFELSCQKVRRCTIESNYVQVRCFSRSIADNKKHRHSHEHDHEHEHEHEHEHGRRYKEIATLIRSSTILEPARELALSIFHRLARAEARVHGKAIEDIHFHEVGALDAIIDIVGFSLAYVNLGIEKAWVTPPPLGSGTVQTEHGLFPLPAPAVAYILAEVSAPTSSLAIPFECLTPTGAAILCSIATGWGQPPGFTHLTTVGAGAGTLDPAIHPNVVRVFLGALEPDRAEAFSNGATSAKGVLSEVVAVIEANLDDLAPDLLAFAQEKLLEEGALDVSVSPITMKKGRSGHLITVIAKPSDRSRLEEILFRETSSLGLRSYFVERLALRRESTVVDLPGEGKVSVKLGYNSQGKIVNVSPEYRDCAEYARKHDLPLKEVFDLALSSYRKVSELD